MPTGSRRAPDRAPLLERVASYVVSACAVAARAADATRAATATLAGRAVPPGDRRAGASRDRSWDQGLPARPLRPGRHRRTMGPLSGRSPRAQHLDRGTQTTQPYQVLIVDQVGYVCSNKPPTFRSPWVSSRYERGSIIITSNRGFEAWGEILGDAMVAAALIGRLVHDATMVTFKARATDRDRGISSTPASQSRAA
jgi:hypothetical protein